jgi:hypothetical protein
MYLGDQPESYRHVWGRFVVEQLALSLDLSDQTTVEIHAGQVYIDAIAGALRDRGIQMSTPVKVTSMGDMLQWYETQAQSSPVSRSDQLLAGALVALTAVDGIRTKIELAAIAATLRTPGLYSWWVDREGAADLSRGLGHPISAGLIYAGQAGATSGVNGKASAATLAGRLLSQHFNGSTGGSTFRLTIGSILAVTLGRRAVELEISQWMSDHLRVATWSSSDPESLFAIERSVLAAMDPPLNLDEVAPTPRRAELTRLRRNYSRRAPA